MREAVAGLIAQFRPQLQNEGGDVEFIELTSDGVVRLRLTGACEGCPMSVCVILEKLQEELRQRVPGINRLESI